MDRAHLDVTRLAAALLVTGGERHAKDARRVSYRRALELYSALEDAQVTETSLAMAMHGAWCSETRSGAFHEWSYHRPDAGQLVVALSDPGLDDRLAARASDEIPEDDGSEQ